MLASAYAARPDRFVGGPPTAAELPDEVWINRALPVTPVNGARVGQRGQGGLAKLNRKVSHSRWQVPHGDHFVCQVVRRRWHATRVLTHGCYLLSPPFFAVLSNAGEMPLPTPLIPWRHRRRGKPPRHALLNAVTIWFTVPPTVAVIALLL